MSDRAGLSSRASGVAALFAIAAVAALSLLIPDTPPPLPPHPPDAATPGSPARDVLVTKLDNVAEARPHTGLGAADTVYVEPIEGGLTRLAAVYTGARPELIGPVRSARESDIDLLAQYGAPVLAYSGAAPELLPALATSALQLAGPRQAPAAYTRDPSRPAPHDLYVHPHELPASAATGHAPTTASGPAPPGGIPTTTRAVNYAATRYGFIFAPETGGWSVRIDGQPLISRESGPVNATTVVVQRVPVRAGRQVSDTSQHQSPVADTVGDGPATVLRDGKAFSGTWHRSDKFAPTTLRTAEGAQLPLGTGQVWVLLVPQ